METKRCTICKQDLPKTTEYFATRADRKTLVYQSSCRICHSEYRKKHYQENLEKYKKKAKDYTRKIVEWFTEIKKELVCENCGENRYWVLDFHHTDPLQKENDISVLIRKGSKKKLLEEVKKCKVLCSNCHRDLHYQAKQAAQVLMNTHESSKLE